MNKDILNKLFPDMVKLIEEGKCPTCKQPIRIEEFNDPLSVKEFRISGMCQKCQNNTFGDDDKLSMCCGAPITDTGRCSDCKENVL